MTAKCVAGGTCHLDSRRVRYDRDSSQTAFAELVARYINLVYLAAKRQLRSHHLTEEVAQQAFIVRAQHA
jgi:DNA-directed RNA polymerase specialized sigma24 family protein